jgi:hypothetical protein
MIKDATYTHGAVAIGSAFNYVEFDNFRIDPLK